jgi:Transglycosylase SLT domain
MNPRTTLHRPARAGHRARTSGTAGLRHPAFYAVVAAVGAVVVNVASTGQPAAQAQTVSPSVSVAHQLGLDPRSSSRPLSTSDVRPLQELAASRSQRESEQVAAAQAQSAADQAARDAQARAQAEAEAKARAEAAAKAAAARPASFQDYALGKLGGDQGQFSCLESLWGKESGWNPNAQNPSSTAYGIPQLLDSTWASTGIGKTSDGYRQIDAGLVYIDSRYGSPCGAWSHSRNTGWY